MIEVTLVKNSELSRSRHYYSRIVGKVAILDWKAQFNTSAAEKAGDIVAK